MSELEKVRYFYRLKNIGRMNSVQKRKESSAEHSWSCLVLADYFLSKIKQKLNKVKVYEMLLYHDLVEIEEGDVDVLDQERRKEKKERELKAAKTVALKIPLSLSKKYSDFFIEFEECKTKEAQFCKAIDALDAEIHEMDYKEDWKGWKEDFLRKSKQHLFDDFPELRDFFEQTIEHAKKNGYFNQ